jgi:hypothetical protein
MSRKIGNSLKDSALFLQHAIKHPLQVGYLLPSSPWLIEEIAATAELAGKRELLNWGPVPAVPPKVYWLPWIRTPN